MADDPIWLAGQRIKAGKLQNGMGLVTSYTPALESVAGTNPTLGSGSTQAGWYTRDGMAVRGGFYIAFGTAGVAVGTGTYSVTFPVPLLDVGLARLLVGSVQLIDSSGPAVKVGILTWVSGGDGNMRMVVDGNVSDVTTTAPWTWAASDSLTGTFAYPGDF